MNAYEQRQLQCVYALLLLFSQPAIPQLQPLLSYSGWFVGGTKGQLGKK